MSLFDKLGGGMPGMGQPMPPMPQMNQQQMQYVQQLKQNPAGTLQQAGLNIPAGMQDPWQIIGYLMQSRQLNPWQMQMIQRLQMMPGMKMR